MISVLSLAILLLSSEAFGSDNGKSNFNWTSLLSKAQASTRSLLRSAFPSMYKYASRANVSSECERGLMAYYFSLIKWKSWAVRMFDASGKLPSGILDGTVFEFGDFEECLNIRVHEYSKNSTLRKEKFRGQYCTIGFKQSFLGSSSATNSVENHDQDQLPEIVKDLQLKLGIFRKSSTFWLGICVPSACSKNDIQRLASQISGSVGIETIVDDCQKDEPLRWKTGSIVAICALSCLMLICFNGTMLDIFRRTWPSDSTSDNAESVFVGVLKSFSVVSNSEKLFQVEDNTGIGSICGIKFLSATWIILGHTYFFNNIWKYEQYRHAIGILEKFENFTAPITIEAFTLSINTFFVVSGYLLFNSVWKSLKENDGKLNFLRFLIHKYWRFTPALGLAFAVMFVLPTIGSGPLWNSSMNFQINRCEEFWWTNFLYVSHWVDTRKQCLDFTWFVSALMQLQIIGAILILTMYRWKTMGILIGILSTSICLVVTVFIVLWRKYPVPDPINYLEGEDMYDYGNMLYSRVFFHFASFYAGIVVSFCVEKYNDRKLPKKYQIAGWIVAALLAMFPLSVSFVPPKNRSLAVLYNSFYRTSWSISVAWLIYACVSGYGGFVNRLLSLKIMQPLAQLTYMMYLLHPLVLIYKDASSMERTYFGHSEQIFSYLSTFTASLLFAYLGYVTVELPFAKLESLVFRRRPKK